MSLLPRAIVYIDGFNLYRRALSGHNEYKWLDLVALSRNLLPEFNITHVRYFSAHLKPEPFTKPGTINRQQIYIRALRTLSPTLTLHWGKYHSRPKRMLLYPYQIDSLNGGFLKTTVRQVEEKGSDVNLASWMLVDAMSDNVDLSVILTNDSDQVGPLNLMKEVLNKNFGIIFPTSSTKSSKELKQTKPLVTLHLTGNLLLQSQFPSELHDAMGHFQKPKLWGNSEGPIAGAF
jgi:hypothetical protein